MYKPPVPVMIVVQSKPADVTLHTYQMLNSSTASRTTEHFTGAHTACVAYMAGLSFLTGSTVKEGQYSICMLLEHFLWTLHFRYLITNLTTFEAR